MRRAAIAAMLALAVPAGATAPGDWRQVVSVHDRQRLRDWRTAWMEALDRARAGGGAATIAGDPVLYGADAALVDGALPPPGSYRCRRVVLGTTMLVGAWGRCPIEGTGTPLTLTSLDGVQRLAGSIHADSDRRAIFLGSTMFAEERHAAYGHAAGRDVAGVVERIGERRWRLVLPYPRFGGTLDVIELVPE